MMSLLAGISILAATLSPFGHAGNVLVNIIMSDEPDIVKLVELLASTDEGIVNRIHDDGTFPLEAAITTRKEEIANILISRNADVNTRMTNGMYPVHGVITNDLGSTMELLLTKEVDFEKTISTEGNKNGRGPSCLHTAVYCENKRMLDMLLAKKPAILEILDKGNGDVYDSTALHEAVCLYDPGNAYFVEALLNAGASIDVKDTKWRTALHYAAMMDRTAAAKILVERGANRYAKDKLGRTPLSLAQICGCPGATKILLEADKNFGEERTKEMESRLQLVPAYVPHGKRGSDIFLYKVFDAIANMNWEDKMEEYRRRLLSKERVSWQLVRSPMYDDAERCVNCERRRPLTGVPESSGTLAITYPEKNMEK